MKFHKNLTKNQISYTTSHIFFENSKKKNVLILEVLDLDADERNNILSRFSEILDPA